MKSGTARQERLTKQNEISRQKLAQELTKLERMAKSDLRMLETERHRFWLRYKDLGSPQQSGGSSAIDVQMYETHNPGFCYHRTGSMKERNTSAKGKVATDSYDRVCSMLFTKGKVDPEKVVCLHLLAAHCAETNNDNTFSPRPVTPLQKGEQRHFTGAWNNILPCYVVNRRNIDSDGASDLKLHEDPRQIGLEERAMRDFEDRYRRYMESNSTHEMALSANAKPKKMAPSGVGQMPIISPHVYSLLGASHELKVRQALAEDLSRKRAGRSSHEFDLSDAKSHSLRLDSEDRRSSGYADAYSTGRWGMKSSERLTMRSSRLAHPDITMLKRMPEKSINRSHRRDTDRAGTNEPSIPRNALGKKSNVKGAKETPSDVFSMHSHFHNMFDDIGSLCSFVSDSPMSASAGEKSGRCMYLNSPIKSIELRGKNYKAVRILVNYQTQALVQFVLEILQRVNPEKMRRIIQIARSPAEIQKMLDRREMLAFLESLRGQSLITSPENYVVSAATLVDEIDPRLEAVLEKEIIAFTLDSPQTLVWDELIDDIQSNIFGSTDKQTSPVSKTTAMCCAVNEDLEGKNAEGKENVTQQFSGNTKNINTNIYQHIGNTDDINKQRLNKQLNNKTGKNHKSKGKNVEDSMLILKMEHEKLHKAYGNKCNKACGGMKSGSFCTDEASASSQYTFPKATPDCRCAEADRIILQRLSNSQRILVGQACASLKTKKINNEGLIKERTPLAAFMAPALSRESIKVLTRGTVYSMKNNVSDNEEEPDESNVSVTTITGSLLAKVIIIPHYVSNGVLNELCMFMRINEPLQLRQEIAKNETKQRLENFLETGV